MARDERENTPEQAQQPVVDAAEYAGHGCCRFSGGLRRRVGVGLGSSDGVGACGAGRMMRAGG
jgi:hypothetical protein